MVRAGIWPIVAVAVLSASAAGTADRGSAATRSAAGSFLQAVEAFDFGRWRESALLFEETIEGSAGDGSRGDVQVYGQRWVPFLPHFFLGWSLFEIGDFARASEHWEISRQQLDAGASSSRSGTLLRYEARRLKKLAPDRTIAAVVLPRTLRRIEATIARAQAGVGDLESVTLALPQRREEWLRRAQRWSATIEALDARRRRLLASLASEGVPPGDRDIWETLASITPIARDIADLEAEVAALEVDLMAALSDLSRSLVEELERSLRQRGREPGGGGAWEPRLASFVRASDRPSCGYDATHPDAARFATSDYLAGTAIARSQSCEEVGLVGVPRLECALAAWGAVEPGAAKGSPAVSLALSAARCGEREAARRYLSMAAEAPEVSGDSLREEVEAWLEEESRGYPGPSRAVVIGAWQYRDWPDLPGARRDALRLRSALEAQSFDVEFLANPTRQDLETLVERLERSIHPDERLVVYYAGHGHLTRSRELGIEVGWIVPVDAPSREAVDFRQAAVSMDEVRQWSLVRLDRARQQLLVLDSCFSGQVFLPADSDRECPPGREALRRARDFPFLSSEGPEPGSAEWLGRQPARVWMSAGSARERVSDDSQFAAVVADALERRLPGADLNADGWLPADTELGPFLRSELRGRSSQVPSSEALCAGGDVVFEVGAGRVLEGASLEAGPCAGEPLAVLEDIFRWEALSKAGAVDLYVETTRCGIFTELVGGEGG